MLRRQGSLDDALAEFERAIATNPKLTVAYMGAGDIYREKGDYPMAVERYGKAAEIEPSNFNAQYLHGLMLQLIDRVAEAVRAYLRALAIRPDDFNTNLNLATAYLQLQEPNQGITYAERAVRLDSRSAPARVNLGAIYSALGRNEDAVVEYQQAAELTELSAPLLLNLAESYGKSQRYEEMVNTLDRLVRTEPTALGYERLGSGYFRLKRYPESLAAYRKAVEIDPNHYPALNGIAVNQLNVWILSNQVNEGAHREALSALRKSLQIERDQPKVLELLTRYQ
jgi:tetratricopeptide (TPR) repeat protein